jgi:alpha-beta hydrolase superfamily lysophospholipase
LIEDIVFITGQDGIKLTARHWKREDTTVRGAVVLVHGMGEHGGRYRTVADELNRIGLSVLAYDQRGHGLSPGKRGHAPSARILAGDAAAAIAWTKERYPELPLFLYGHSMGGGVALSCALRHKPGLTGLILTSPWLRLAFEPPAAKLAVGKIVRRVWPSLTMTTGLNDGALYRGEEQLIADLADPLLHNRISAGMSLALMEEGERSLAHVGELDAPLLLLHGTADRITSFEASREAASTLGGRCRFVPWDGGFHELHHDLDKRQVLDLVTNWTASRM